MEVLGLVALAGCVAPNKLPNLVECMGILERSLPAMQRLLHTLVAHIMRLHEEGRPQGGRVWNEEATFEEQQAVHLRSSRISLTQRHVSPNGHGLSIRVKLKTQHLKQLKGWC